MPIKVFTSIEEAREHFRGMERRVRPAIGDLLDEAVRVGEQSAKIYAPKRTRKLEGAISSVPAHDRESIGVVEASVGVDPVDGYAEGSPDYPFFVNVGTGLFGPLTQLIRPKVASRMVFEDRVPVVARTVRGQQPQSYMDDALEDVDNYLDARIDMLVDRIIVG